jgi:hypothetical protein
MLFEMIKKQGILKQIIYFVRNKTKERGKYFSASRQIFGKVKRAKEAYVLNFEKDNPSTPS